VIIDIFAAVAFLLCAQYATYGVEQLPDRLNSCVGDFAIYKSNTKNQIDKLLTEDFHSHSEQLLLSFNKTGEDIVRRFKRGISADVFDELIEQEMRANRLKTHDIPQILALLKTTQTMHSTLSNGITKMKEEYKSILDGCQNEYIPACTVAARVISNLESKAPILEKVDCLPFCDVC
jgi:hypothetical protein